MTPKLAWEHQYCRLVMFSVLYYFDRFGRPVSHGEWPWPKSVGCPASQRRWPSLKGQKIGQIFKISAGRPNSGQVLAEILHLSQGIFKLANAKISATLVPCPTPGRIDRNSTVYSVAVLSRKTKIGARRYSSVETDDIVRIGSTERVMTLTTSLRSENAVVK